MIAVAQFIREHRVAVTRTLREMGGVGLTDLGDGLSWGEARDLIEAAIADPSTVLGAEMAGWAYPASMKDIFMLTAAIRDPKVARQLMPWVIKTSDATADEIAEAEAALEDGIVFS